MMIRRTSSQAPTKRLVIKSLKDIPKLPENFGEETWSKLSLAIDAIHHTNEITESKESLYNAVKDLCVHKLSEETYKKLYQQTEAHLKEQASKLINSSEIDLLEFLTLVNSVWNAHCDETRMIRDIFLYLDRTYSFQHTKIHSLWDMGLYLFRNTVFSEEKLINKVVDGALKLIEQDRSSFSINRSLLQNILRMLTSLELYFTVFEKKFLDQSASFYAEEVVKKFQTDQIPQYLEYAEQILAQERQRVHNFLEPVTLQPLLELVQYELITSQVQKILEHGFFPLMDNNALSDLARLYSLFDIVSHLDDLQISFASYIQAIGLSIVIHPDRDPTMVEELLAFKSKIDVILQQAFKGNNGFLGALKEAFKQFINKRPNKPAELLARFVNKKLQSGEKGLSEEELEAVLDQVMTIFRFINGKDVFQAFYRTYLAKRLLLGKSVSTDLERAMISKLKAECGAAFTSKFEGMFTDMNISKELMTEFHQKHPDNDLDMSVHVLTMGTWPSSKPASINLPPLLAKQQQVFEEFYLTKYNGRKLTWQNAIGHCVLRATFPSGKKELILSLFQSVVVLLFNGNDKLTLAKIREDVQIEESDLKAAVLSLSCGTVRLLVKKEKGHDIDDSTVFYFNKNFKNRLFRLRVNQVQMKQTEAEQKNTEDRIFIERQYQIDAAIVRIMKTRKSLSHTLLLNELFNQLSFPVELADIKKRIESLLERDYLERDANNAQLYHYLA